MLSGQRIKVMASTATERQQYVENSFSRRNSLSYESDDSHESSVITLASVNRFEDEKGYKVVENHNYYHHFSEEEYHQLSRKMIGDAFRKRIESIDLDTCQTGSEDSFFVADLGVIYRQHLRWTKVLPRVEPFYAVKCNNDRRVLGMMAKLGMGFDCASKNELSTILNLGVDPSKVIYANPCKTPSYLRYVAEQTEVKLMTFDNADELYKCKRFFPNAHLLLRIMTDDSTSLCQLSVKFGASMDATKPLLQLAKELELNVVGVAFHVGSGCADPNTFTDSIKNARQIFDQAKELGMPEMHVLDVGGGFESETFEASAKVLNQALEDYFPDPGNNSGLRIIAEPGRYYVATAFSLATNVIGRRWVDQDACRAMVYINDGVYGNLNCIMYDHQHPVPKVLAYNGDDRQFLYGADDMNCHGKYEMSFWGPTCDGLDCITTSCEMPVAVDVGDWIYFDTVGAYTLCAASSFNGFDTHKTDVVYVCSDFRTRDVL